MFLKSIGSSSAILVGAIIGMYVSIYTVTAIICYPLRWIGYIALNTKFAIAEGIKSNPETAFNVGAAIATTLSLLAILGVVVFMVVSILFSWVKNEWEKCKETARKAEADKLNKLYEVNKLGKNSYQK